MNQATNIYSGAFRNCGKLATAEMASATNLGTEAFINCSALTSVTIGKDGGSEVKTGSYVFYNCGNLETANLYNVKIIGSHMFNKCGKLKNLTVKGTNEVYPYAFANCVSLPGVDIESAAKIWDNAFNGCTALATVTLNNATEIGDTAFYNCGITTLTIPKIVKIGSLAFQNCNVLTSVSLPASLTTLGERAFTTCEALESITVGDDTMNGGSANYFSTDGVLYSKADGIELLQYPQNKACDAGEDGTGVKSNYTDYNINYTVGRKVGSPVDDTNVVPVTKVHKYAFESNNTITSVEFPPDVVEFDNSVFYANQKTANIFILNGNENPTTSSPKFPYENALQDKGVFYGIPQSFRSTLTVYGYSGTNTEMVCLQYKEFKVKFISLSSKAQGLQVLVTASDGDPNSAADYFGEIIGYNPTGPDENGDMVLMPSGSENVVIPSTITQDEISKYGIGIYHRTSTDTIESFKFPVSESGAKSTITIRSIGSKAFNGQNTYRQDDWGWPAADEAARVAAGIKSITLPQSLETISAFAFEGCSGITEIAIPEGVKEIEDHAFKDTSIKSIRIPDSVSIMGESEILNEATLTKSWGGAFGGANLLERIEVGANNPVYSSTDGVLFTKGNNGRNRILLEVPPMLRGDFDTTTNYTIPDGTVAIAASAFSNNHNLKEVTIPGSVRSIGVGAFKGTFVVGDDQTPNCYIKFVESDTEPEGATGIDIQNEAFAECDGLVTIDLPWYVERISDDVFKGCTNLKLFSIYIPDEVGDTTVIEKDGVLYGYTSLEDGVDKGIVENYAVYKFPPKKESNGSVVTKYTIDSTIPVRQIYKSAFEGNTNLTDVTFSDLVQVVQDRAFAECTSLVNVDLKNATYLGSFAFTGCDALKEIKLPTTMIQVDAGAFVNCDSLTDVYVYGKDTTFSVASDANGSTFDEAVDGDAAKLTIHCHKGSEVDTFFTEYIAKEGNENKFKVVYFGEDEAVDATTYPAIIHPGAKEWISFVDTVTVNGKTETKVTDEPIRATADSKITLKLDKLQDIAADKKLVEIEVTPGTGADVTAIKTYPIAQLIPGIDGSGSDPTTVAEDATTEKDYTFELEMPADTIMISVITSKIDAEQEPVNTTSLAAPGELDVTFEGQGKDEEIIDGGGDEEDVDESILDKDGTEDLNLTDTTTNNNTTTNNTTTSSNTTSNNTTTNNTTSTDTTTSNNVSDSNNGDVSTPETPSSPAQVSGPSLPDE